MRRMPYLSECRKSNLFCDNRVWQKKQTSFVMIGVVEDGQNTFGRKEDEYGRKDCAKGRRGSPGEV